MIKFYFHDTPNPLKVALMLEETGLPYEVVPVDILRGDQHSPEYRAINPNGKVPAIDDDGEILFDSNAILLYLAEKTGHFLGRPALRPQLLSWLMFVASGVGPFSGQAVHFSRAHTDSAYATNRYRREIIRHYELLDDKLRAGEFILGDDYTIVDMAAWGWITRAPFILGEDAPLDRTPALKRWFELVDSRPAAKQARAVSSSLNFKTEFDDDARRSLFPQNAPASL